MSSYIGKNAFMLIGSLGFAPRFGNTHNMGLIAELLQAIAHDRFHLSGSCSTCNIKTSLSIWRVSALLIACYML